MEGEEWEDGIRERTEKWLAEGVDGGMDKRGGGGGWGNENRQESMQNEIARNRKY